MSTVPASTGGWQRHQDHHLAAGLTHHQSSSCAKSPRGKVGGHVPLFIRL